MGCTYRGSGLMVNILRNLISVEKAKEIASDNIKVKTGAETVTIENAAGRVTSSDIFSPINSPPFNRSIKDGIAVISADTASATVESNVRLKISGSISMGLGNGPKVERGCCVKIPTGGVMPEGADAVVMVEYTTEDSGEMLVSKPVMRGENVAFAGSDTPKGELILRKGVKIGPRETAVLSTLGISEISVRSAIRIGVISTGDEIVQPGERLEKGEIYESNGRTIKSLIEQKGSSLRATFYGTLPDKELEIKRGLDKCITENDIVIVSGSTSAGEKDLVYRILGTYDPGILFHGVMIKPGKPTLMSKKGEKVIIGLPGFPVSAMMTFLTIFFPYIMREAGLSSSENDIEGIMAAKANLDLGKLNLIPVSIVGSEKVAAFPIYGGSGSITRILRADGYISVDGSSRTVEPGEEVTIRLFDNKPDRKKFVLAGESGPLLDAVESIAGDFVRVIKTGHYSAIESLKNEYAHAAALILPPEELIEKGDPAFGDEASYRIIHMKEEEIGVVSRWPRESDKDLPVEHLKKAENVAVTNRSDGSSTVIDRTLRSMGLRDIIESGRTAEVGDFNSVAFSVSEGYYQLGICDRETAQRYGLAFSSIGKFRSVLVSRKDTEGQLLEIISGLVR